MDLIITTEITKVVLVGIGLFLSTHLIKKAISLVFLSTNFISENKERTIETFLRSIINFSAFVLYLVYIVNPYIDVGNIVAGAGIAGIVVGIILRRLLEDISLGLIRLYERQFSIGDWVIINGVYRGTIQDIRVRLITVREWSGRFLTMPHSQVEEIHNYNRGPMNVVEHIAISKEEDPELVIAIIEQVCNEANETMKEWLEIDETGKPLQPFHFDGVTNLNRGMEIELTVVGTVKPEHYFDVSKRIRYQLAVAMYKGNVKRGSLKK